MIYIEWIAAKKLIISGARYTYSESWREISIYINDDISSYTCIISKTNSSENKDLYEFRSLSKKDFVKKPTSVDFSSIEKELNGISSKIDKFFIKESEPIWHPYSAAVTSFSSPSNPTDVFGIKGSESKIIRVNRLEISLTTVIALGTSTNVEVLAIVRSTPNSGSSNSMTAVPHDSQSPEAEAPVFYYTANPTLGTTVGVVRSKAVTVPTTNILLNVPTIVWEFYNNPIYLRSSYESLAINLNSNTLASDTKHLSVEWEEL